MQANAIKFGFFSGYSLVYTAFQPSGLGRGLPEQPLPEVAYGYYSTSPLTDLVVGDMVLVYAVEQIYWEGDPVYILTPDFVYYEGGKVTYENDWVYDFGTMISDFVTSIGDPVGSGEYDSASDTSGSLAALIATVDTINTNVNTVITNQNIVVNVYNETALPASSGFQLGNL